MAQRLYPVVEDGLLTGVVTRQGLLTASAQGDGTTRLSELAQPPVATTHADATLRQVAEQMALCEVSRVLVVDRDEPRQPLGVVSLTQLLAARQRDQKEARDRERVLRLRLVAPRQTTTTQATT